MVARDQIEGLPARRLALRLIAGVLRDRRMLSDLEAEIEVGSSEPQDRARAGRLARAVLRQQSRADAALRPYLRKAPSPSIRDILRLGTVELLGEQSAAHGVVNAAVALTKEVQPRATGMANAVLRRVAQEGASRWAAAPPQRLPNWVRGRLSAAYGNKRVAAMEAVFEQSPEVDLTPRNVEGSETLAAAVGGTVLPGGSVRCRPRGAISELPGYADGDWWVQDAGAALAARLLAPCAGETVLDLCAAPGGKTLQVAASGAHVTAVDSSDVRTRRLRANLARCKLTAEIIVADALAWTPPAAFDAILLDAPCSATGTLRRHPDLPFVRDASGLSRLIDLQAALLDRAVAWLRPGGRLVYCTCSLLPEEGEAQISAALARHPTVGIDDTELNRAIEPIWRRDDGTLRLTPETWAEHGGVDGFFVAVMRQV